MGFWGILGVGAKIFCGNPPRNAMTADLRRLVKKCGDALNTVLCTSCKEITKKHKKTECLRRENYISPLRSAYPPKSLVTSLCMWGPMGDVIIHAQFQLNWFRD